MTPAQQRIVRAAMRWHTYIMAGKGTSNPLGIKNPAGVLLRACAAAAKPKRKGKRSKATKWEPDTPSPYDLSAKKGEKHD